MSGDRRRRSQGPRTDAAVLIGLLFKSDSGAVRHVDGPFAGDAYLADHLGPKRSGNRVLLIKPECVEHVRGARRIDWLFTLAGHLDEQRLTLSTRPVWSTA